PTEVIDEVKYYIQKYQVSMIEFYDLTAIVRKDWIIDFCNLYLKNNLKVGWSLPSGTRSEALDDEVLPLLYKTNCKFISYAPESGSNKTLKEIKKQVKLERLVHSVRNAARIGIATKCNLIIGFPKDTHLEVLKTLFFQIKLAWLGVDDVPIYMYTAYPGSALFDYLRGTRQISDMNDEYFDSLLAYSDLGVTKNYCENISGGALRFYRIMGISNFYALSYIFRPWRILRTFYNVFIKKVSSSVFEQRLLEMLKRASQKTKPA
ncbi:MAG: radical SAM protein, partial [Candidatus Daviesbacteria bacterium]|nr:radical SAM protein [Candidatus Daviesbacteria bacterium]